MALLALAPGSASASAGPQYDPDDPAYMTEVCKHDTSPSYPSCGGGSSVAKVRLVLPDPWFTTEPCKHDTSPSYPSCGGPPR